MQKLRHFLKPYRKYVILGPLFKLLEAIFELIVPVVMAKIIDIGIAERNASYIGWHCALIVLLGICGLGFALTCQYFASKCAFSFGTDLRGALFRHIRTLSRTEIDQIGTSALITRITTDVTSAQQGVNMAIRLGTRAPFLIIGAIVMTLLIDCRLSLIFLVIAPILGFVLYTVLTRTIPMYTANQKQLDGISRHTGETLDGVRVIRAFARQEQETAKFREECAALEKSMIAVGRISVILNPLTFLIMNLGIAAVLWFGGLQIEAGRLSQGDLTAFANYMTQILLAGIQLAGLIQILTKAQASALRTAEILETQPSMQNGTETPLPSDEAISFDHVNFAYADAGDPALQDITFTLRKGQTLGIIGGTGSGKSTIAALMQRFYDPTSGTVRLYGKDVRSYDMQALNRSVGFVPQKAVLFTGTVEENLRMADQNVSPERMREALEIAQASEIVRKLQFGLQTHLVQGGRNLSGGQKQRLTIARALCADPEILILDDSTSALDYATDAALRKALRTRCTGMTKVIISQRTVSLQDADLILVMDDGRCIGMGTHSELLASCGVYREICEAQGA
ncbi:MAG: ABC transporter ATP-binding protein/permease [Oscillospiraceae bacterium]|nr:ABC transporter ATP-binding protein/permease [Oscillospiraceae bacterium]